MTLTGVCASGAGRARPDLGGGGLRRSAGGWEQLARRVRGRERWTHDERVLGSSDFVAAVVERTTPPPPRITAADAMPSLVRAVAARWDLTPQEIASSSLRPRALAARAVVCQLGVCGRGWSLREVARALGISKQSVARAVERAAGLNVDTSEFYLPN